MVVSVVGSQSGYFCGVISAGLNGLLGISVTLVSACTALSCRLGRRGSVVVLWDGAFPDGSVQGFNA